MLLWHVDLKGQGKLDIFFFLNQFDTTGLPCVSLRSGDVNFVNGFTFIFNNILLNSQDLLHKTSSSSLLIGRLSFFSIHTIGSLEHCHDYVDKSCSELNMWKWFLTGESLRLWILFQKLLVTVFIAFKII